MDRRGGRVGCLPPGWSAPAVLELNVVREGGLRPSCRGTRAVSSLNHLVGPAEQRLWNREAQGLGALEVDDQLELGGLLHRQIARLGALPDLVDEDRRAPPYVVDVRPIGDQPACLNVLPEDIYRRKPALGRQFCEPL